MPRGFEAAASCSVLSLFNTCGDSLAGKFREKASILHKIAKKKCQVEDSEKANGVASCSGKRPWIIYVPFGWFEFVASTKYFL